MPELPEVEHAAAVLRRVAIGRRIVSLELRHPSLRRRVSPSAARALRGRRILGVVRRGKHQLVQLDDGRALHVHFRMTGDWHVGRRGEPLPRFARAVLVLDDDTRIVLDDSRALSTIDVHGPGDAPALDLGPEPDDERLTASSLRAALARRRGAIKPALLDQRLIAGIGNIYAAEALWVARIDPRAPAAALGLTRLARLLEAIRVVIGRATGGRHADGEQGTLVVYDREGEPCARCGAIVRRIVQAGRSTCYCPRCQRR